MGRRLGRCARVLAVTFALAGAVVSLPAAQVASAQPPTALSLAEAFTRATEANRTLLAARTARAIDTAGVLAAAQRPNPEVAFEYAKETPHWAFTGTVPLELYGKRQRRLDVANATVAVTDAETARIAADLRADVRRAYFTAVAATRRVTIAQELETLATRVRDAA